jgi:arylsulfatase A
MQRLIFILPFFLMGFIFSSCKKELHPNVLLILADDQGWGDLSVNGNPYVNTPNIDKISEEGITVDRFFVSPLCAPTRASLLTGKYHLRAGTSWVTFGRENLYPGEYTLGDMFKEGGYATACLGKWHNGSQWPCHPNAHGFDEFIGFCGGDINRYFDPTLEKNGKEYSPKGYITDILTKEALQFIEKNKENPFFCYIPYNVCHAPFIVPDKYFDRTYPRLSHIEDQDERNKDAAIYAMLENLDDNIALLMDKLEETGLMDNTIVIFLSDNGPNGVRYNGDMRGIKNTVHEGGVRVPFYIKWPGKFEKGKVVKEIAAHIDLLPTLASLCNLSFKEGLDLDGEDISPLLFGENVTWDDRNIFTHNSRRSQLNWCGGIRNSEYRFVQEDRQNCLYDMKEDPGEKIDLKAEKSELFFEMRDTYNHWVKEVTGTWKDPSVISIGYQEWPVITLNAPESKFTGNISFHHVGWTGDFLENWISEKDSIYWNVKVINPGKYLASILYTCPEKSQGSSIIVSSGSSSAKTDIKEAFDPPFYPVSDRTIPKNVGDKPWKKLIIGAIDFRAGDSKVILSTDNIPVKVLGDIKSLILERQE